MCMCVTTHYARRSMFTIMSLAMFKSRRRSRSWRDWASSVSVRSQDPALRISPSPTRASASPTSSWMRNPFSTIPNDPPPRHGSLQGATPPVLPGPIQTICPSPAPLAPSDRDPVRTDDIGLPLRAPAGKATSIDLRGYTNILTRTLDDRLGPSRTGKICPYPMGCADIEPPKTASPIRVRGATLTTFATICHRS